MTIRSLTLTKEVFHALDDQTRVRLRRLQCKVLRGGIALNWDDYQTLASIQRQFDARGLGHLIKDL